MEIDNIKDCIEVKVHAGLVIDNKTFELLGILLPHCWHSYGRGIK